jgi:hypothetical protein
MGGNTLPQFTKQANISSVLATTAQTTNDGSTGTIGTNYWLAFTADATNGSYVEFLRVMPVASAAGTAMNATTIRVFVSSLTSGSVGTANTYCIYELAIPAVTADQGSGVANNAYDIPLGFRLPAGYTILVTTHVAATASAAYRCTVFGGDY